MRTLRKLIRAELDAALGRDARTLQISISAGVVMLAGQARSPAVVQAAERAVRRVPEVMEVALAIEVLPMAAERATPGGSLAGQVDDWMKRASHARRRQLDA